MPTDLDGQGYPAAAADWAEQNGCDGSADEDVSDEVIRRTFDCPDGADVEFYIIEGGGHSWPGSDFSKSIESIVGHTTFDIDATELDLGLPPAVPPADVSDADEPLAPRRRRYWLRRTAVLVVVAGLVTAGIVGFSAEMREARRETAEVGEATLAIRVERIRLGSVIEATQAELDRTWDERTVRRRRAGHPRRAARGHLRPAARAERRAGRAGRRRPELHVLNLDATKQCLIGVQRAIEQASVDDNRGALRTLDSVRPACDRARAAGQADLTGQVRAEPDRAAAPRATCGPRCWRGCSRGRPARGSCCDSRISTRWRPARSTWPASPPTWPRSASTGTARSSGSPSTSTARTPPSSRSPRPG